MLRFLKVNLEVKVVKYLCKVMLDLLWKSDLCFRGFDV